MCELYYSVAQRLRIDAAREGQIVSTSGAVAAASVPVGLSRTQELPWISAGLEIEARSTLEIHPAVPDFGNT